MCNISDMHFTFRVQWDGNDIFSVQLFVYNSAAHSVTVEADQKIKKCGAVPHPDIFGAVH